MQARLALILLAASVSYSFAATQATRPDAGQTKRDALEWLAHFAQHQALFHADDVKSLRERVEAMSPDEAATWWETTAPQRRVLSSPEWIETEAWLRKFLAVQARYSDEDVRYFQSEAAAKARESAESLQQVLNRVTQARQRLIAGSQAAAETRRMQLEANEAFRQEDVRRREESLRQGRARPAATFPTPASPPARQQPGRYNQPLVDSLDVARWAVLREIFPRW